MRLLRMKKDYAVVIYHKGEYPNGQSVAEVANILENGGVHESSHGKVGRPTVKRWPFTKNVKARNYQRTWRHMVKRIADNIVNGTLSSYYAGYHNLGRRVVEQLQEEIYGMMKPELAASTIKKKGHSKPLIDTMRLVNSIHYKVVHLNDPSAKSKPFMPKWVTKSFGGSSYDPHGAILSNLETDLLKLLYQNNLVDSTYAMRPYEEWKHEYAATMKALFSGKLEEMYQPSEKYQKALKDFIGHDWSEK